MPDFVIKSELKGLAVEASGNSTGFNFNLVKSGRTVSFLSLRIVDCSKDSLGRDDYDFLIENDYRKFSIAQISSIETVARNKRKGYALDLYVTATRELAVILSDEQWNRNDLSESLWWKLSRQRCIEAFIGDLNHNVAIWSCADQAQSDFARYL